MHMCVCIWRYILQNYNYKLHFQNLSIYTTFCMNSSGPWLLKILLGLLLILISKSWGCPPRSGMLFLDNDTCAGGGLFMLGFSSLYDAIHGWMMGWMMGWMDKSCDEKIFTKNDHDVLYYLSLLVWTSCLMHRCVCIWQYILQNYNSKIHFQNLSIYHILHVSIGTLAAENLDVCIAYDPWDNNI